MYAIRQYEFGGAEQLRWEELADPTPGAGQVRIAVAAAGVHLIDTALRSGAAAGLLALPELPTIPGREVAGHVDAVGDGVDPTWMGRRVVAHLGSASGGYAELAVCAVESLHVLDDALAFEAAVAMIGTGRTTMGILDAARVSTADVMVVAAAAGGIGSLLVQTGHNVGATVVGLAGGADKLDRVREVGATIAVDYRQPNWTDTVREQLGDREVTVVFEGVGGDLGRAALSLLAPGGRLLMYGWASSAGTPTPVTTEDLMARSLTATWAVGPGMLRRRSVRDLEDLALAEAASDRWKPVVQTFPLARAADAHRALEGRATLGKIVLTP